MITLCIIIVMLSKNNNTISDVIINPLQKEDKKSNATTNTDANSNSNKIINDENQPDKVFVNEFSKYNYEVISSGTLIFGIDNQYSLDMFNKYYFKNGKLVCKSSKIQNNQNNQNLRTLIGQDSILYLIDDKDKTIITYKSTEKNNQFLNSNPLVLIYNQIKTKNLKFVKQDGNLNLWKESIYIKDMYKNFADKLDIYVNFNMYTGLISNIIFINPVGEKYIGSIEFTYKKIENNKIDEVLKIDNSYDRPL